MIKLKIKGFTTGLAVYRKSDEETESETDIVYIFILESMTYIQGTLGCSILTNKLFLALKDLKEGDEYAVQISEKSREIVIFPPFILDVTPLDEKDKEEGVQSTAWITRPFKQ